MTGKQRRKMRHDKGLCVECDNPPVPGRLMCANHAAMDRIRKARFRSKGHCVDCCKPAEVGHIRCSYHLDLQRLANRSYYRRNQRRLLEASSRIKKKRKAEGVCTGCGAPLYPDTDSGKVTCVNCRIAFFKGVL